MDMGFVEQGLEKMQGSSNRLEQTFALDYLEENFDQLKTFKNHLKCIQSNLVIDTPDLKKRIPLKPL